MRAALLVFLFFGVPGVLAQDGPPGEAPGESVSEESALALWLAVWAGLAAAAIVAAGLTGWLTPRRYQHTRDVSPRSAPGWLLIAFLMFLAQGLTAALAAPLVPAGNTLAVTSVMTIGGAMGVLLVLAFEWNRTPAGGLRLTPETGFRVSVRDAWVGVLVCAGAIPLVSLAAMLGQMIEPSGGPSHETLRLLQENDSPAALWLTVAAVCVAAPVAEELLFRGGVQSAFRRAGLGPLAAALAASVLFLMVHVAVLDAAALPALLVLSLVLGLSFERTGRIGTPIVAHACFNAFNIWAAGL